MSESKSLYPPSPPDVPEGLADYADSFAKQQKRVLAGLFVFLIFYFALIVLFAMVGVWCFLTLSGDLPALKVGGIVLSSIFCLFLVKGLFKRSAVNREMYVELHDDEHPKLFDFIEQLCHELGAPFPNRVYACPDVIAEYTVHTTIFNLVTEPQRELLIGMGLVNCTNLSEFKAVLAHEFGQFCHLGRSKSSCAVVQNIVFDMIEGEDFFDRILKQLRHNRDTDRGGFKLKMLTWPLVYPVTWMLETGRAVLWLILKIVALPAQAMKWEQEFHADLVAVSAAGSDALTHSLLRVRFGMQCFNEAIDDLLPLAEEHDLYSNDLYLHQDRAAAIVRWKNQDPELGLPPALLKPNSGESIRVFDTEADEYEDDATPPMWRDHPASADREENAKEHFVPALMDHRSPWILFENVAELKDDMAFVFYRVMFHIGKDADLTDAREVQGHIDQQYPEVPRVSPESCGLAPKAIESVSLAPVEEPLPVVQLPLSLGALPAIEQAGTMPTFPVASTMPAAPGLPVLPVPAATDEDETKPKTIFDDAIEMIDAEPHDPDEVPLRPGRAERSLPQEAFHGHAESTEDELFVAEAVAAETVPAQAALPVVPPAAEVEPAHIAEPVPAFVATAEPEPLPAAEPEPVSPAAVVAEAVAEPVVVHEAVATPVVEEVAEPEPEPVIAVAAVEEAEPALVADAEPAVALELEAKVPPPVEVVQPITPEVELEIPDLSSANTQPTVSREEVAAIAEAVPVVVNEAAPMAESAFDAIPTPTDEGIDGSESEIFSFDEADADPAAAVVPPPEEASGSGTSIPATSSSEVSLAKPERLTDLPAPSSPSTGSLRPIVRIGIASINAPAPRPDTGMTPAPRPAYLSTPIPKPDAHATPIPRAAFGSGAPAVVVGMVEETVIPAAGRRPAVRLTFVKPGELSPIG